MVSKILEYHGHLYLDTYPDIWDAWAALASMALTTAIFCLMISSYQMINLKPRNRYWWVAAFLIWTSGLYYTYTYLEGIQGVVAVLYNPGGDVQPDSVLRTIAIAVLCFTAAGIIHRFRKLVKLLLVRVGDVKE